MMVEAGAKLLPEDVMAEAILFGHRALQPLIDIQERAPEGASARPRARRSSRPAPARSSTSRKAVDAGDEFVVVDVETTGTDPKMADLVEIAAVKVKGGKIIDRWSTLVNPGRADRRQPDARHHRRRRQEGARARPTPPGRRSTFIGDAVDRRPLGRLRPRASSRRPSATAPTSSRAATSTR